MAAFANFRDKEGYPRFSLKAGSFYTVLPGLISLVQRCSKRFNSARLDIFTLKEKTPVFLDRSVSGERLKTGDLIEPENRPVLADEHPAYVAPFALSDAALHLHFEGRIDPCLRATRAVSANRSSILS